YPAHLKENSSIAQSAFLEFGILRGVLQDQQSHGRWRWHGGHHPSLAHRQPKDISFEANRASTAGRKPDRGRPWRRDAVDFLVSYISSRFIGTSVRWRKVTP